MATPLTRRAWLQGMTAIGISGFRPVVAPGLLADEAPVRIRFGFSLYGMKSVKVGEALAACARIGYDGVELALLPDWPTDPRRLNATDRQELKQQLADSGLGLYGLMENLTEPADAAAHRANLDRLKTAAELGNFLSPKTPPVIETVLGGRPAQWDEIKDPLAARLQSWAEVAAAAKTIIAVKPHVSQSLHTPAGAMWLMVQVASPWLRLAFDYSHFRLRDISLAAALSDLLPLTEFIHVKDVRGTAEKVEFLLPGEGDVDYGEYFRQLIKARYGGPVVVEVSGQISSRPGYDPLAAARLCYESLAPAIRKAHAK